MSKNWQEQLKNERMADSQNFASQETGRISKSNKAQGAGKGDGVSAKMIFSNKYKRSMEANDAYARGEITLDEWRFIVYGLEPEGQGEN